jgi:hypothetical protein
MKHKCPPRCHLCPLMDGDLMPWCMGTAAMGIGPRDKSHCTCRVEERERRRDIDSMGETIRALLRRVHSLEEALAKCGVANIGL